MRYKELILQILHESDEHLTAEQIFLQAKERQPAIVMATVYNNLATLTEEHVVRKMRVHGQADRYDKNTMDHDHLICDKCGALLDVNLDGLTMELEERLGIDVGFYELNIHYICDTCKKEAERANKDKEVLVWN